MLAGCKDGPTLVGRLLSLTPLVFIGKISYSLYLWHWPLFSLSKNLLVNDSFGVRIALTFMSFILAYLSWRFVEEPFRKGGLLKRRSIAYCFGASTTAVLLCLSFIIYRADGFPNRYPESLSLYLEDMNWSGSEYQNLQLKPKYIGRTPNGESDKPDFLLWGDSHGMMLAESIDMQAKKHGLTGEAYLRSGSVPISGLIKCTWDSKTIQENEKRAELVLNRAINDQVPNVILVHRWNASCEGYCQAEIEQGQVPEEALVVALQGGTPKVTSDTASEDLGRKLQEMIDRLTAANIHVWIVKQVPENNDVDASRDFMLSKEYPRWNQMERYTVPKEEFLLRQRRMNDILCSISLPQVTVVDLSPPFFESTGKLEVYSERVHYRDEHHLSRYGAKTFAGPQLDGVFKSIREAKP